MLCGFDGAMLPQWISDCKSKCCQPACVANVSVKESWFPLISVRQAVITPVNVDRASAEQDNMQVLQDMGRVIVSDINAAMLNEGKQRYGMPWHYCIPCSGTDWQQDLARTTFMLKIVWQLGRGLCSTTCREQSSKLGHGDKYLRMARNMPGPPNRIGHPTCHLTARQLHWVLRQLYCLQAVNVCTGCLVMQKRCPSGTAAWTATQLHSESAM